MGARCCTVQGCTQMVLGTATSYLGTGLVRGEVGHQSMYVVHVGNVLSVDKV